MYQIIGGHHEDDEQYWTGTRWVPTSMLSDAWDADTARDIVDRLRAAGDFASMVEFD